MTRSVQDDDPMVSLRLADPVDPEELERMIAPLRSRVMRSAIERGGSPLEPPPMAEGAGRGRRLSLVFAVFACAAAIAAIVFSGGSIDSIRQGGSPAFADAAVRVAEANPRLLITAPGWRIVEAKSFRTRYGQLLFGDGDRQARLVWFPAPSHPKALGDERPSAGQSWTSTVGGLQPATSHLVELKSGNYFSTDFPPREGISVSLEGAFATRSEWEALMASVRSVGVEAWLDAMPAEVLRPQAFSSEAAQMLRGVAVPPGFDASAVLTESVLTNRFQAAKKLTQALTCDWVGRWRAARRGGDEGAAREAAEAMSGASRWPVLRRMARERGYRGGDLSASGPGWPTSILAIGRQMAAGGLEREPVMTVVDGQMTVVGFQIPAGASPPDAVHCYPGPRPGSG